MGKSCYFQNEKRISFGENCFIGGNSSIKVVTENDSDKPLLTFGNGVSVTNSINISCAEKISIGNNCLIAPFVYISDNNHGMDPTVEEGFSKQPLITNPVEIEDGVWIGIRSCVLSGVTIGEHSIIGANSVVTHDIPPYSIAVGAPAKVVKKWDFERHIWIKITA